MPGRRNMYSFFLNWWMFKAPYGRSLNYIYPITIHYMHIMLYDLHEERSFTVEGAAHPMSVLPGLFMWQAEINYAASSFLQRGRQWHTSRYHDMRFLGKPTLPFWLFLLSTAWYLNTMLKVPADILGPWGKGQENYKQPWHSWTAKPTEATAYRWTPHYTGRINTHVFQLL